MILFVSTMMMAQEAYTVYNTIDGTPTLTFYYDNNKATREGTVYDFSYTQANAKAAYIYGWREHMYDIQRATFDASFANYRPTSTAYWFFGLSKMADITGLQYLNTSEVTDMTGMFYVCTGLTSLDLSHFDTSKVTNMHSMFSSCSSLQTLNVSSFNTSNVTDMSDMFDGTEALESLDVSNFNTSKVTNMSAMFMGWNYAERARAASCASPR